jgi:hypothetical protein
MAITIGVLLEVILMIFFGGIEIGHLLDFDGPAFVKMGGKISIGPNAIHQIGVIDARPVLMADIMALLVMGE